jgi:hypothetical protein
MTSFNRLVSPEEVNLKWFGAELEWDGREYSFVAKTLRYKVSLGDSFTGKTHEQPAFAKRTGVVVAQIS